MTETQTTFEPQNALEKLLVDAANDTPGARPAFEAYLLEAPLYAAAPKDASMQAFQPGDDVQLLSVMLQEGEPAAALFTSGARAQAFFGDEVSIFSLKGRSLVAMVRSGSAILNPGSPYGVTWTPAALAGLLGLPEERTVSRDTEILLGAPAEVPDALVASLRKFFGGDATVKGAWLALAQWAERGEQAWFLDVRAPEETRAHVQRVLTRAMAAAGNQEMPLDMVIKAPGDEDGVGIEIVAVRD